MSAFTISKPIPKLLDPSTNVIEHDYHGNMRRDHQYIRIIPVIISF